VADSLHESERSLIETRVTKDATQQFKGMGEIIAKSAAEFLNLRRLPVCLNVQQVAAILNRHEDQIYAIIHGGLLKPLGNPSRGSVRLFATKQVFELGEDLSWLDRVQRYISRHHSSKSKNKRKPDEQE
jgi:hypothetical protein